MYSLNTMGIKDLTAFITQKAPNAIQKRTLGSICQNDSSIKKAAIDTSLYLYKFKYSSGENFLVRFLEQINRLAINNIIPIYVFDGKPPTQKFNTIQNRKEKRDSYTQKITELTEQLDLNSENINQNENSDEIQKLEETNKNLKNEIYKLNRKSICITKENISQLKYFLDLLNIRYIHGNCEADLICSKLNELKLVDMVLSDDMDHLTSGTQILVRDFHVNNNQVTTYSIQTILNTLDISYEKWIEFCIMCGCDYVKRIPKMGPNTSFKYIKDNKDKSYEDILETIKEKKEVPNDYLDKFNDAKNIFLNQSEEVSTAIKVLNETRAPLYDNQLNNIRTYLKKYTPLSNTKIENRLTNIYKLYT